MHRNHSGPKTVSAIRFFSYRAAWQLVYSLEAQSTRALSPKRVSVKTIWSKYFFEGSLRSTFRAHECRAGTIYTLRRCYGDSSKFCCYHHPVQILFTGWESSRLKASPANREAFETFSSGQTTRKGTRVL